MLAALIPHVLPPLTTWEDATPLPTEHTGLVIARQVGRLDGDQQGQLLRWIRQTTRRQVWRRGEANAPMVRDSSRVAARAARRPEDRPLRQTKRSEVWRRGRDSNPR